MGRRRRFSLVWRLICRGEDEESSNPDEIKYRFVENLQKKRVRIKVKEYKIHPEMVLGREEEAKQSRASGCVQL